MLDPKALKLFPAAEFIKVLNLSVTIMLISYYENWVKRCDISGTCWFNSYKYRRWSVCPCIYLCMFVFTVRMYRRKTFQPHADNMAIQPRFARSTKYLYLRFLSKCWLSTLDKCWLNTLDFSVSAGLLTFLDIYRLCTYKLRFLSKFLDIYWFYTRKLRFLSTCWMGNPTLDFSVSVDLLP